MDQEKSTPCRMPHDGIKLDVNHGCCRVGYIAFLHILLLKRTLVLLKRVATRAATTTMETMILTMVETLLVVMLGACLFVSLNFARSKTYCDRVICKSRKFKMCSEGSRGVLKLCSASPYRLP
jgi:hypothetical protein